ncbi:MAG: glutamate synthase large subunit [Thermodesulfobacteriota bacterium]
MNFGLPPKQGLYDPAFEHDACGVGFLADIGGEKSHDLLEKSMRVLANLTHRGAVGSDPRTGDGAGLLFQLPDEFFRGGAAGLDFELPPAGRYAAAMVFLPRDSFAQRECMRILEGEAEAKGCRVLGWREVPLDREALGMTARATCPEIKQFFVKGPEEDEAAFERRLYLVRRRAEKHVAESGAKDSQAFHVPSFSSRTIVYKGMMLADQVPRFYPDLASPAMKTALCVLHQRYSTNTFPTWALAQPFRFLGHNGEINTLRGNINNMRARYGTLHSEHYGEELEDLLPVVLEGGSDSACFDNMLEFLVLGGRSLAHALMMMAPEAWGEKYHMGNDRRAFYEFHAMFMEPWDGPAALVCTDGHQVGATLDRNGLRPARYVVTKTGLIVLASEVGVLDIPAGEVQAKGRLGPGRMILVDTRRGRWLGDEEVKAYVCRRRPYRRWVAANRVELRGLFGGTAGVRVDRDTLLERQRTFGYTREDLDVILRPMVTEAKEPVGSMGDDTPPAVLSPEPRLLFNYFKQLFAQVTNPAIDPIREELVMSLTTYLGRQGNLLGEAPDYARMLKLRTPILTNDDLERIRAAGAPEFKHRTLAAVFDPAEGEAGLARALVRLGDEAEAAVRDGCTIVILSDLEVGPDQAPVPSLLAVAAANRRLVTRGLRTSASVLVESGEPREVMHFALLLGYGATAVNPSLAFETIAGRLEDGFFPPELTVQDAVQNYIKAIEKGLLKIFSKMGISTLRSYRGAQIFEALGLSEKLVEAYFPLTPSRLGGIDLGDVAREAAARHAAAFDRREIGPAVLAGGGDYSYRRGGRRHLWTPNAVRYLQQAARRNDRELYARFAALINEQAPQPVTLRSLFAFKETRPAPLEEVEPASEIVKRFFTGAMSFGSISREAHETLALAMNHLGGRSNSGEGGEDRNRYRPRPDGSSACSRTKQVASGRFGVTTEYLVNAEELQIKIAQGAKPGEGGQLPGHKVNVEIARVRHSTPGVSLISPPPHHDIYSIEDLKQLIFDLKNVNPQARINVKLVSEVGVGTIAAGVAKGHADAVLISGGDGGTGASPVSSIKHAGVPWELGLSETHQVLVLNGLRGRLRVQADGQMRTGRDVAVAALLGAEEFGFATAPLVVLGCVMMRQCHQNTCPVGVATQDPRLRARFTGRPEHLVNYFYFVAEEVREIMAALGLRSVDEMIGRADLLKMREDVDLPKARRLDFSAVFRRPLAGPGVKVRREEEQDHGLGDVLDLDLIAKSLPAVENGQKAWIHKSIRNTDRTTGAMLSGLIARKFGAAGLPADTITLHFTGSAGQSFGAFGMKGLTLVLEGDSNDYLGKGLSGAKIIVRPPEGSTFDPAENMIVGNVALYGATSGEAYFCGLAGERFAIRNSGARAVVEGVGDHGCEYMTGGVVVVLGRTGVNFAAGMSGGIAFVYDPTQDFDLRCNLDMVDIEPLSEAEDIALLRSMIEKHLEYTGSRRAAELLENWDRTLGLFVKVMPMEYRRALGQMLAEDAAGRRTEAETVSHV